MAADNEDQASGANRREHQRYETSIAVDYASGETFLFAYLKNISEMGIFIRTNEPQRVGTRLRLRFQVDDGEPLVLDGENLNPGMGVRFIELTPDRREQVVALVRTVAYLRDD